jgi:D-sedoheptulose 7-phosphate isomerase
MTNILLPPRTDAALVRRRVLASVEAQSMLLEGGHTESICAVATALVDAFRGDGKLLLFGNGGSAGDAQHVAAELLGRYLLERRSLPAIALTANSSTTTAIANDYGFERVFARQVEALAQPGDVALGISTSGKSENVILGLRAARDRGAVAVALTGGGGGRMREVAEHVICVPAADTPRIQEGHILVAHILCELVELEFASS